MKATPARFFALPSLRLVLAWLFLLVSAQFCAAEERVALVVGNSAYANTPALPNPRNDATDVANALGKLGFKVILRVDAGKTAFDQGLAEFEREAQSADVALFYYAGHGMQYEGRNYLMPVDAQLRDRISLHYEMVSIDDLREQMANLPGVKLIILDSCRNNPLAETFTRSIAVKTRGAAVVARGLAPVAHVEGMLVVYSTAPDNVAEDGAGRNSPFSQAFVEELAEPHVEAVTVFRRVQSKVIAATHNRQSPEVSFSSVPDFYFNLSDTDRQAWEKARDSRAPEQLADFLQRFPRSDHSGDAQALLDVLRTPPVKAIVVEPKPPEVKAPEVKAPAAPEVNVQLPPEVTPSPTFEAKSTPPEAKATPAPEAKAAPAPEPKAARAPEPKASPSPSPTVEARLTPPVAPPPVVAAPSPAAAAPDLFPDIRAELRRIGCFYGGDIGWNAPQARGAIQRYAQFARVSSASLQPDADLLNALRARPGNFCHLSCAATQVERNGQCVAKLCPAGEILTSLGACAVKRVAPPPPPEKRIVTRDEAADPEPAPRRPRPHPHSEGGGGGGKCFTFNGNSYCN